jgi:leucyl aminopeptidase
VKIDLTVAGRRLPAVDRIVVGLCAGEKTAPTILDAAARAAFRRLAGRRGFKAEAGQTVEGEAGPRRTLQILGLGGASALDGKKMKVFVEKAVESSRSAGDRKLAIVLPEHELARGESAASRIARDAALASYRFDRFRSDRKQVPLAAIVLASPAGEGKAYRDGVAVGRALADGIVVARDLANTPPNEATPAWMAGRARALARRWRARVQILGPAELKRRGMGGILAVGAGSENPPRLVRIEIGRGAKTVALVGKGVTFDTGGISIKPADGMDRMKDDMAGAAAVVAAVRAIARLGVPRRVVAVVPATENMPGGNALKPGDVIRGASGLSVEINNTDAEGRLILGDGLWYARQRGATHLVDVATLTGACVVALGKVTTGLFGTPPAWISALRQAAARAGEPVWELPLGPEYRELLKSDVADMVNSGGRAGGAISAAMFLREFAGDTPWAHLDIAGTAWADEAKAWQPKGPTGVAVRTLAELAFTSSEWR